MEDANLWALLRAGKAEQERGLNLVRQAYTQKPCGSEIMQLGIALLWLGRYVEAWEHYRGAIREYPRASDGDYGMAGVAKWCLGEQRDAVSEWNLGLRAKYERAGLGVKMPLLLYFASVIRPDLYASDDAKKVMLEKTKNRRIKWFPGPILQWILGQISEDELRQRCQGRHEPDLRNNLWQVEFYRSLMTYEKGEVLLFRESMSKLSDIHQPEWQSETVLLDRIWCEEFFLARHEAQLDSPS
ncbi:MAG TPA: hypothetical protein VMV72_18795 [Verrucomicrobiae bacterium]|nr:hypothetical protein [Verrucomicrobiae bacterium]